MEQVVEKLASGLGNSIGFLASSGILYVLFALLWVAFGAALIWSQGSLEATREWIRGLPLIAEGAVWLLFLPVTLGLWIWGTAWPVILRLVLVAGIAGWTLLVFPKPWK
jgi:hypothetical protein